VKFYVFKEKTLKNLAMRNFLYIIYAILIVFVFGRFGKIILVMLPALLISTLLFVFWGKYFKRKK